MPSLQNFEKFKNNNNKNKTKQAVRANENRKGRGFSEKGGDFFLQNSAEWKRVIPQGHAANLTLIGQRGAL